MEKKRGVLIYDPNDGRWDIIYEDMKRYGGLHCGDCFEALFDGRWEQTRIEKCGEWYLVDLPVTSLTGLPVRVSIGG